MAARKPAPPAPRTDRSAAYKSGRQRSETGGYHRHRANPRSVDRHDSQQVQIRRRRRYRVVPLFTRTRDLLAVKSRPSYSESGSVGSPSDSRFPTARQSCRRPIGDAARKPQSRIAAENENQALRFIARLDDDRYYRSISAGRLGVTSKLKQPIIICLNARVGSSEYLELSAWFDFSRNRRSRCPPRRKPFICGERSHWKNFWTTGAAIDLSGSSRPACNGARTPHRPLAIPDRDPVRRLAAAAGNRPDMQQLVRQVSSGDALVARRAFCAVESSADARKKPGWYAKILPGRARAAQAARLRRRALAENDRPRRPRQPVADRAAADLAAAASDLLRGALSTGQRPTRADA